MAFTLYEATIPVFVDTLTNMRDWLDKAAETPNADLLDARLAPDMRPFSAQYQMTSDTAKNAVSRLLGIEGPAMPDTETSVAELRERCDRTIAFLRTADEAAINAAEDKEIVLKFPNGMGFTFTGRKYVTGFVLPNFYFHATTAYALLRANGAAIGKIDFLRHLGSPDAAPAG